MFYPSQMEKIIYNHKLFWSHRSLRWSAFIGFLFLIFSLFVNYWANIYATLHASRAVTDLFLSNLPVVNVDFLFLEGFSLFLAFVAFLLLREPKKIPFVVKSIAIFILIRSIFITLTHIHAPYIHSYVDPSKLLFDITSGEDLFFSSHTGLPFLMALMFWDNKALRWFFIAAAFVFGAGVLLGHLHYSIDVFAAPFITYAIFRLVQKFFPKDYKIFLDETSETKTSI